MHNTTHVLLNPALTNSLEFHGLAFTPMCIGVGLQARVQAGGWVEITFSEPWQGSVESGSVTADRVFGIKVFPGVPLPNLPPEYARFVWNQAVAQGWQRERGIGAV